MAISTNGTVLTRLAGGLYNTQMSNATYKEVAALDPSALANVLYSRDFNVVSDATVAKTLVTNLGLSSVAGLDNWVAAQLTAAGANKGAKVVELLNSFAQMSADATYGAAATAFNNKVDSALALSQTTDNAGGAFDIIGTSVLGKTFSLTSGVDNIVGSLGVDTISGVIDFGGARSLSSTGTTLNTLDSVTGGSGSETLNVVVQNAGAAVAAVASAAATAQVNTYAWGFTAITATQAPTTININVGGTVYSVVTDTTATPTEVATLVNNAFNNIFASSVSVLGVGATGSAAFSASAASQVAVQLTAPTAGTALPPIVISASDGVMIPSATKIATANGAGTAAVAASTVLTTDIGNLTSVENVVYTNNSGEATTTSLTAAIAGGTTKITNKSSANDVTFTSLGKAVTVGLDGVISGATTATYNGLAATDSVSVLLSNASSTTNSGLTLSAGSATGAIAPRAVTITGAGKVSLTDSSLTSATISTNASSTVGFASAGTMTSVNASGSTSTLAIDLATGGVASTVQGTAVTLSTAVPVAITGGSGNDTISVTKGQLDGYQSTWTLNAGTGTDTLRIVQNGTNATTAPSGVALDATSYDSSTAALTAINNAVGFETLNVSLRDYRTAAASSTDVAFGPVALAVNAVTSVTDYNISASSTTNNKAIITGASTAVALAVTGQSNQTFTIGANITGGAGSTSAGGDGINIAPAVDNGTNAVTLSLSTASSLTIKGGAGSSSSYAAGDGLDVSSYETVTLASGGSATSTLGGSAIYTFATGSGNSSTAGAGVRLGTNATLNITGSKNIVLGDVVGTNFKLDANALTGDLTFGSPAGNGNTTLIGGSGKNTISIVDGVNSLDLTKSSAISDTITISSFAASSNGTTASNAGLSITGLTIASTSGDKIDVLGTGSVATSGTISYTSGSKVIEGTINATGIAKFTTLTGTLALADYVAAVGKTIGQTDSSAATATNAKLAAFELSGNTYIVVDQYISTTSAGASFDAGKDVLVTLVGTTGVVGLSATAGAAGTVFIV